MRIAIGSDHAGFPYKEQIKARSEEHTSELQSRQYLVCRLLLEKKKSKSKHSAMLRNKETWHRMFIVLLNTPRNAAYRRLVSSIGREAPVTCQDRCRMLPSACQTMT